MKETILHLNLNLINDHLIQHFLLAKAPPGSIFVALKFDPLVKPTLSDLLMQTLLDLGC